MSSITLKRETVEQLQAAFAAMATTAREIRGAGFLQLRLIYKDALRGLEDAAVAAAKALKEELR